MLTNLLSSLLLNLNPNNHFIPILLQIYTYSDTLNPSSRLTPSHPNLLPSFISSCLYPSLSFLSFERSVEVKR